MRKEYLKESVISRYSDGMSLQWISNNFDITIKEVKDILLEFKNDNKKGHNRILYKDELFMVVAERDLNGVSRRDIETELEINIATVRSACEKFGKGCKSKKNPYIKVDCKDLSKCPHCNSDKVNQVDEDGLNVYCMDCGNEFFEEGEDFWMIDWSYIG